MHSINHLQTAIDKRNTNSVGEARTLGIEIEMSDLEPNRIAQIVQDQLGGNINWITPFEIEINDTQFGTFKLELDSSQIKEVGQKSKIEGDLSSQKILSSERSIELTYLKALSSVASTVVPWEIVSPPLLLDDLPRMYTLVEHLRKAGAKGTRDSLHYSFGVHLNPEGVDLTPQTIVNHLRSFFCLYEWIVDIEKPDLARRIAPHINHFPEAYISKILDPNYQPDLDQLINDYIDHNPNRNRDLDMLPMFAFLKPKIINDRINDSRVNARPTYHYRLPNCDIDNPLWNIDLAVELWMTVEELAMDKKLSIVCAEYNALMNDKRQLSSQPWKDRVSQLLQLPELDIAS